MNGSPRIPQRVQSRSKVTIAATDVMPGDLIELAKTSGGVTLTAERTLILDVREHTRYVDDHEIEPNVWLRLDPTGVPTRTNNPTLGTFLEPDDQVEVWR